MYHCYAPSEIFVWYQDYFPAVQNLTCFCNHNGKDHIHWIAKKTSPISMETIRRRLAKWRHSNGFGELKNQYQLKKIVHIQNLMTAITYICKQCCRKSFKDADGNWKEEVYFHSNHGRPDLVLKNDEQAAKVVYKPINKADTEVNYLYYTYLANKANRAKHFNKTT